MTPDDVARAIGGAVLALDTSSTTAALALVTPHAPGVISRLLASPPPYSERLVGSIAELLRAKGVAAQDLKGMVVGLGPGSFTGLRVGLATIKGMSVATGCPVYGVSSLAIMASSALLAAYDTDMHTALVVRDAGAGRQYWGLYKCTSDAKDACVNALVEDQRTDEHSMLLQVTGLWANDKRVPLLVRAQSRPFEIAHALRGQGIENVDAQVAADVNAATAVSFAAQRICRSQYDDLDTLIPTYLQKSTPEQKLGL